MADEIKVEVVPESSPPPVVVTESPADTAREMGEILRIARDVLQVDALLSALADSRSTLETVREELRLLRESQSVLIDAVNGVAAAVIDTAEEIEEEIREEQQQDIQQDGEIKKEAVAETLQEAAAATAEVAPAVSEELKKRGRKWL